jgi:hypothetical protein
LALTSSRVGACARSAERTDASDEIIRKSSSG